LSWRVEVWQGVIANYGIIQYYFLLALPIINNLFYKNKTNAHNYSYFCCDKYAH